MAVRPASADPPRCPLVEAPGHAEFSIHLDGAVVRAGDGAVRNSVAIFGDVGSRQLAGRAKGAVRIEVFGVDSRAPGFSGRVSTAIPVCVLDGDLAAVSALPIQLAAAWASGDTDLFRVVIHIDQPLAISLGLPRPVLRSGDRWAHLAEAAVAAEAAYIRGQALLRVLPGLPDGALPSTDEAYNAQVVEVASSGAPVIADALRAVQPELQALIEAARIKVPPAPRAPPAGKPPPPPRFPPAPKVSPTYEHARAQLQARATPVARDTCALVEQAAIAASTRSTDPWLFGSFDLPAAGRSQTVEIPITGLPQQTQRFEGTGSATAWVTYIPAETEDVRIQWVKGAKASPSIGAVLGAFISALEPTGLTKADLPTPLLALTTAAPGACSKLRVEYPLTPLAAFWSAAATTRSAGIAALDDDTYYMAYACHGRCVFDGAKATTIGQRQLRTRAGWGLTLYGAIAYDARWRGQHAPLFTEYRWVPTTAGGGSQLFELQEASQPRRSVSSSLYLALRFPECRSDDGAGLCWIQRGLHPSLGFGPTILLGDGSGKLAQWTVNLFVAPAQVMQDGKLAFTVGAGFRLFDRPDVGRAGDVVQAAMAPALTQSTHAAFVMTLGFAIDLAVLGDAAGKVFGTKAPPDRAGGAP